MNLSYGSRGDSHVVVAASIRRTLSRRLGGTRGVGAGGGGRGSGIELLGAISRRLRLTFGASPELTARKGKESEAGIISRLFISVNDKSTTPLGRRARRGRSTSVR